MAGVSGVKPAAVAVQAMKCLPLSSKEWRWRKEAVHQALVNLEAVDAPRASMPVVLGPGWPAVLLHEAVGHGLEADFNRKGSSSI